MYYLDAPALNSMPASQHPATYTIGKRGTPADFKSSEEELLHLGADIEYINRGGETTFHGPGQVSLQRYRPCPDRAGISL